MTAGQTHEPARWDQLELSDIDLLNGDLFSTGMAEEYLTFLRNNAPVWRHPDPTGGPGTWMITKHEDVAMISRDHERFSADRDNGGINALSQAELGRERQSQADVGKMFIQMDPPEHGPYRKNLQPGFAKRVVGKYTEHILEITQRVLDRALDKGTFDFVQEIAVEIPLNLVADVLGIPAEDRRWLFEHVTRAETPSSPEQFLEPAFMSRYQESVDSIRNYGELLIKQRARNPQDDLTTRLAQSQVDGESVPLTNSVSNFFMLWSAGAETTRTALSWGMYAFMQNPDQWQVVRDSPDILETTAVEEVLRWASPVRRFRRNVMEDIELRGQRLRKGDGVVIWYVSANRDEDVFQSPFRFDVNRAHNPHLGFGGGGPHFCMGASLARLELNLVFREIARRVPHPELVAEPRMTKSSIFRALSELPVKFA